MAVLNSPPQAVQPASSPLIDHLGSRACWLTGSGRPKDPTKPNGDPLKAPCDRNGYPLKSWQTAPLDTYAQAAAKISPPNVRFVGIRSSAAGAAGKYVAGFDLDDVLNAGHGCIDAVAWYVWTHWPTYTEVTPSGYGLRMWWIVEGDAQPVSIKTERDRKTGLSEVAFTAGVFNGATVEPQTFNIGRELYYRADRYLIVTGDPYAWLVNGSPDPLRTITADQLREIAALVKAQRPPSELVEAINADATHDPQPVQIGATMTTTQDSEVVIPQPARVIEAQPAQVQPNGAQAYAMAALQSEVDAVAMTREGGRNDQLNKAAYKIGGYVGAGAIDPATAAAALESAAVQAGLSEREAAATARSGLNAGAAKPRAIPERPAQPGQTQGRAAGVDMGKMRDRINAKRAIKIEVQS